jgi:hypothetical protein
VSPTQPTFTTLGRCDTVSARFDEFLASTAGIAGDGAARGHSPNWDLEILWDVQADRSMVVDLSRYGNEASPQTAE